MYIVDNTQIMMAAERSGKLCMETCMSVDWYPPVSKSMLSPNADLGVRETKALSDHIY